MTDQNTRHLLPPNATALERALAATINETIANLPVPIGTLWHPDTCPADCLPWLAWALSVDRWDSLWPVATQRQVLRNSIAVHRQKGTVASLRKALASLDVKVVLEEWFENGGEPHTFTLTALAHKPAPGNTLLNAHLYHTIQAMVDATKPVRSHYQLRVGAQYQTGFALGMALNAMQVQRLSMEIV